MSEHEGQTRQRNINFRQTPREFRAQRQASVFARVKRNLPYNAYHFSKEKFIAVHQKIRGVITRPFAKKKQP